MRPSINNSNSINNINSLNERTQTQNNNSNIFSDENSKSDSNSRQEEKEKSSAKKEKVLSGRAQSRPEQPILEEVKNHFSQNSYPTLEAEKFYNHYESNGWLVGGKTPMKNWKASANNWMLNTQKFNLEKSPSPLEKEKGMRLNATTNKNYNEPL